MTYARSHLIDPNGGTYHLTSRCVRRAFLFGTDEATGINYDHRRHWIEARILELSEIFSVDLYGYAVLHNHYHLVLSLDPDKIAHLTNEQIAAKWFRLCPPKSKNPDNLPQLVKDLANDKKRIKTLRERLRSISWFMRFLNESIARRANKEDGCTGRFWEGRFKSQKLLGENSILACMAYVDLNPVRAGITRHIAKSKYTSLTRRLNHHPLEARIASINTPYRFLPTDRTLESYLEIVKATNKRKDKFQQLPEGWFTEFMPTPGQWQRAIGSKEALDIYAKELGQKWIKTTSSVTNLRST